jgi:ABC-type transport system involved in multi-copper enzyme maturation permease subunit
VKNQIKAELLKIRSTRTTMGLLIGLVALALLFIILTCTLSPVSQVVTEQDQVGLLSFGSIAGVFAALAGIMLFTSEFRFGTIRPTFLFNPSRSRLFASKMVAGALAGLVFGIIGEGLTFIIGLFILKARGIPISLSGGNITVLIVGSVVGTALWGIIGVGLGAIIPNQVGAVIALLAWGFVVENLVFGLLPSVGRFLPVHAQDSMIGFNTQHYLSGSEGTIVLIAWTALLAGAGLSMLRRRDIN